MTSFQRVAASNLCGAYAQAALTSNPGLAAGAVALCGAMAGAYLTDAALTIHGSALCGAMAAATPDEDILFVTANVYGSSMSGSLAKATLYLDNDLDSLTRYLPAGDSR